MEGHGREEHARRRRPVPHGRLVHRRVPGRAGRLPAPATGATMLKSVKEQLRAVPAPRPQLRRAALPEPGRLAAAAARRPAAADLASTTTASSTVDAGRATGSTAPGGPGIGQDADPDSPRGYLLEVTGAVDDGELELGWTYSTEVHDEATVRRVADDDDRRRCGRSSRTAPARTPAAVPRRTSRWPGSTRRRSTGWSATAATWRTSTRSPRCRPACCSTAWWTPTGRPDGAYVDQLRLRLSGVTDPQRARRRLAAGRRPHPGAAQQRGLGGRRRAAAGRARAGPPCRSRTTTGGTCPRTGATARRRGSWTTDRAAALDLTTAPADAAGHRPAHRRRGAARLDLAPHRCSTAGAPRAGRSPRCASEYAADRRRSGSPSWRAAGRSATTCAGWPTRTRPPARASTGAACWPASTRRPRCRTTGRPSRRTAPSPAASVQRRAAPPSESRRLHAAARRNGLTVNTIVQGAWALLLSRYSGDATTWSSAPPCPAARPSCPASSRWSACSSTPCRPGCGWTATASWCAWLRDLQADAERVAAVRLRVAGAAAGAGATCRPGRSLFDSMVVVRELPGRTPGRSTAPAAGATVSRASTPPTSR